MRDTGTIAADDQEVVPARRLLRTREGAEYIGVCERTFWAMLNSGQIASVRFGSGARQSVRIDLRDLDLWIAENKVARR